MKKICVRLVCIVFVICLSACGARYKMIYKYFPPHSKMGQACVVKCEKQRVVCQELCRSSDKDCELSAHRQAQEEYLAYVHRKKVEGAEIMRDLQSFYDPLQCSKTSCDCRSDFEVCYQMCGGKVKHEKRCIANCGDD